MNYLIKRTRAFAHAFRGVTRASAQEGPFWLHWLAAAVTVSLGFILGISALEWCVIVLCIVAVLAAELLNTALERLCDVVKPEQDERIRFIKDAGAGAVLLIAIGAAVAGAIIFLPYILRFF